MERDLEESGGKPVACKEGETPLELRGARSSQEQSHCGEELCRHERGNDPRDEPGVPLVVCEESLAAHLGKQGVVDGLNRPDQSDETPSRRKMPQK